MTAFTANALEHKYRRGYVFPDGANLGDVVDAIGAAGLAGNYVLAGQLKIQYALDVCSRCATRHEDIDKHERYNTLQQFGIDAFGTICAQCALAFLAAGRTKRSL